jgi:hypothetical protein
VVRESDTRNTPIMPLSTIPVGPATGFIQFLQLNLHLLDRFFHMLP